MSITEQVKVLRGQADKLGITYHHKTGADKLRAMIGEHLMADPSRAGLLLAEGDRLQVAPTDGKLPPAKPNLEYVPITADDYKKASQKTAQYSAGALKRIRFTNMNHNKKAWPGEMLSVGSARYGTWKKYIFFNGEDYHVPKIIYDHMKERECSSFYTVKTRGGEVRRAKMIKEFAITDLPPLTNAELKVLADRQQLASVGL